MALCGLHAGWLSAIKPLPAPSCTQAEVCLSNAQVFLNPTKLTIEINHHIVTVLCFTSLVEPGLTGICL